jgi:hypothetical protein
MTDIRRYQESDWEAVWPILRETFAAGDTYAFSPQSPESEIHKSWGDVQDAGRGAGRGAAVGPPLLCLPYEQRQVLMLQFEY